MKTAKYILAIDPDVTKSGVAMLDTETRQYAKVDVMDFPALCRYMRHCQDAHGTQMRIVIEGGWMVTKSNYHNAQGRRAEKIAKNVGENHGTGKQLFAMAQSFGCNVHIIHPLRKMWQGANGKITHAELASFTGIVGRTNQDARDAALIAWVYAGLPIRVPLAKIINT